LKHHADTALMRGHGSAIPTERATASAMRPFTGVSNPATARNKVDLPVPEPPSKQPISPVANTNETASRTLCVP
jgi:hypothetical protein